LIESTILLKSLSVLRLGTSWSSSPLPRRGSQVNMI
jgi:hypothetical protein